jgi:hypothetical protein
VVFGKGSPVQPALLLTPLHHSLTMQGNIHNSTSLGIQSMSKFSKIYCTTALSLSLSTTAALADVSNADVWGNWQGYMESMGYSITATEATAGNVLTVSDFKMTMAVGPESEEMTATLPELSFTEQGDGSVQISLAPLTKLSFEMSLETGEKIDAVVEYAQDGLNMIATGENGTFDYAYTANAVDLTLQKLMIDGVDVGSNFATVNFGLKDISGNSKITSDELRSMSQSLNAGALTYDLAFSDPANDGKLKIKGALKDLTSNSNGTLPSALAGMTDVNAMLDTGFAANALMTYQGGEMDLAFDSPDGAGTANTTSTGGAFEFAIGSEGITYNVSQTNLALSALMPDIPLPIVVNMGLSKLNFAMPIRKSEEEQNFALGFTMGDFTISDMIWGMFDPAGQLPRNPATLALDLSGKAKVLFDFLDPDQAAALESSGAAPGELNALTLDSLVVDAVGARLTGTGDFTFDNTDLASFDGMPRPTGAVDLKLSGGNGLLDKLVAMGFLPQEQAMGARMMMGLFAVAGPEADTLTSKIEINDAGHIIANGQRIQ